MLKRSMLLVLGALIGVAEAVVAADMPHVDVAEIGREISVDGTVVQLDCAWCFSAQERDERYLGWYADFVISFDRDMEERSIGLYGTLGDWGRFPPIAIHGEVALLGALGLGDYVTYGTVLDMREFRCGVKIEDALLYGIQVNIELRLTDPNEASHFVSVAKCAKKLVRPKSSWFDANVAQYDWWPDDASKAYGGTWRAMSLSDAAEVAEPGVLGIATKVENLLFEASEAKTIGSRIKTVTIVSRLDLREYDLMNLPIVNANWKGGVLVVCEKNESYYYGLAKVGNHNEWTKLDGPAVADVGLPVELRMTFSQVADETVVNYDIGGVRYRLDGTENIPVVAGNEISRIWLGGKGTVSSLLATAERRSDGCMLILK